MIFGFLGFGKMASALVEGMLKAGSCKSEEILVINRHPETVQQEIVKLGIQLAPTTQVMVERSDVIVLGTKPSDSLQLLREVRPAIMLLLKMHKSPKRFSRQSVSFIKCARERWMQ